MSDFFNGQTMQEQRAENLKAEREKHERRKSQREEARQAIARAEKEKELSGYEKAKVLTLDLLDRITEIETGTPYEVTQVKAVLKQSVNIIYHILQELEPGKNDT